MDARLPGVTQPGIYLPVAAKAMDLAAGLVRARLPSVVNAKGDRDMVSDIDVEIERAVRGYLRTQTPQVGFLGEEEGNAPGDGELQWVLDPVDGTANFVKGIPVYAISLALTDGEQPALGVIDVPAERCRYSAVAGLGAYCGDTRIGVRPARRLEDAVVTIGDYAVGEQAEAKNQVRLAVRVGWRRVFSGCGCSGRRRSTSPGWRMAARTRLSSSATSRGIPLPG